MTKTIWVSAFNTGDGEDPCYARFVLTSEFLDKVKNIQALMVEHQLSEVRFMDGPDSWGPDSEDQFSPFARTTCAEAVVFREGVFFNDSIKHEDGNIQTAVMTTAELEAAIASEEQHVFLARDSVEDLKDTISDCGDTHLPEDA